MRHVVPSRPIRGAATAAAVSIAVGLLAGLASAQTTPATDTAFADAAAVAASPADGPTYAIGTLRLQYLRAAVGQPAVEDLSSVDITLGVTPTGYVAPRPGLPAVTRTIDELSALGVEQFHASGLQTILLAVRDELVANDLFGIYVVQNPQQITESGEDLRGGGTDLSIIVVTNTASRVRTIARGERTGERGDIPTDDAIDHPSHDRIRLWSPVPVGEPDEVISRSAVDDYVYFLGRHPGRRVDLAVAQGDEPGSISLDYEITENRPLLLYAQVSNTGTSSTDYWRERFGLLHTQLTDADDIFSFDYTTANFDNVHAVSASYNRPLTNDGRTRWQVFGGYSRYDAEDVGIFAQDFTGENLTLSAEIAWNVHQQREFFVDVFAGVRFDDISVEQTLFNLVTEDAGEFLTPYFGVRLDRSTDWYSTRASAQFEWQPDILGNDLTDIDGLGRTAPDEDWTVLRVAGVHSTYLEPLVNRAAWEDPTTPESSTLAHELRLRGGAQWAFGNRLIPQSQSIVGGLATVRGYPQSVVAADSSITASAEYRYHVARGLSPEAEPRELFGEAFRYAPQFVYGVPDWDLVLKGFADVGITDISDPLGFEGGETLIGAGIGLELLYRRNLNVNLDWGFALEELDGRGVASGANRLHVQATLLF